jgi:site-specific recombinase XerD
VTTEIILAPSPDLQPAPFFTPTPKAAKRVLEFFTGQINNDHTRRAYMNATRRFAAWCAQRNLDELSGVQPFHVAAFIKDLQAEVSPPTVKQHLAALRMLLDWLVTGHVIDVNPAHAVRGPKYVVKKGKTPVLAADEARTLLDSIPIVKAVAEDGAAVDRPDLVGLRDRALIGLMAYSFARVGAVLQMKVGDYFVQERRRWVRLHEKGGKEHDVPCHHNLDHFLDEYIAAAGIAGDAGGYLFRTTVRKSGVLTEKPMHQQDAYRMIQRRAKAAGIETKIGNHTFRATGITAYLKNSGKLEVAQHIANHESPRTTKLYDRRQDEISRRDRADCDLKTDREQQHESRESRRRPAYVQVLLFRFRGLPSIKNLGNDPR